MARPLRVQFEGALYYLTVRANNRQPLFRDRQDRQHYLGLLNRYQDQFGFKIYCYLLADRQVHLLIETPRGNVSKIMQCLGTSYTSYFNRRHKRRGTLFEGRYRSSLIDNERYLPEVTRHIHRTYFRLGVNSHKRRDYPWSSYRIYLGRKVSDLVETASVLGRFGQTPGEQRRGYQAFVEGADSWARASQGTRTLASHLRFEKPYFQRQSPQIGRKEEVGLRVAERILREVSLSLSLAPNELGILGESRRRALTRHVAMYLIRKQTDLPLRSIGQLLGVKPPAVALGIGRVERLLKREDFSQKVRSLLENNTFSLVERVDGYPGFEKEATGGNTIA